MNFFPAALNRVARLATEMAMRSRDSISSDENHRQDEEDEEEEPTKFWSSVADEVTQFEEIMETRQIRLMKRRAIPKALDLQLEFRNLTYTLQQQQSVGERWKFLNRWRSSTCEATAAAASASETENSPTRASNDVLLLHNISGVVRAGEILAVMGTSGSGKSTLIDAIAQRIAPKSLQGSITLNGEEVQHNLGLMRSISAYVMQDDLLFPMLTVKETLRFAAELRLPSEAHEKEARVNEVIRQLNLSRVKDSIIGNEGLRGVSGGERRRVSIGKEIVHDPLLLFLDEPTSGLDSANAYTVVETLLKIAQSGSIVMLSVHQPSERVLKLVTTLLLIADGKTIYYGPPRGMKEFFISIGYDLGPGNTTESALDLMQEFHKSQVPVDGLVEDFRNYSAKLEREREADSTLSSRMTMESDPESLFRPMGVRGALAASIARGKLVGSKGYNKHFDDIDTLVRKFANSWVREVYVLAWRGLLNLRRTPELFVLRWVAVFISAFFLATIFWNLDNSSRGLQERLGFIAFAISSTYYACADTLPIFLQERFIFMRETAHDSYRISSYVFAIALINVPFLLGLALTFSIVTFWSVGLGGGSQGFFFYLVVMWAAFWAGNSFATFLSAVVTNVIMGYSIVVAALAYFLLLSGFFITRSRIPGYWLWMHYLSAIKYPYEAVLLNEFEGEGGSVCYETGSHIFDNTPFAGSDDISNFVLENLKHLLQGTRFEDLNASTCMIDGSSVLRRQGIGLLTKWECLTITVALGLFYRLLFYSALRVSGKLNRH